MQIKNHWKVAITCSIVLHLMIVLWGAVIWSPFRQYANRPISRGTVTLAPDQWQPVAAADAVPTNEPADSPASKASEGSVLSEANEPVPMTTAGDSSAGDTIVNKQLRRSISKSSSRSLEENERELTDLGKQLSKLSNEKSVDDISSYLQGMAGTKRATEARPPTAAKPFDPTTAQFDDVRKVTDESGKTLFVAVLIDANGTVVEMDMDETSGAQMYRTMKLIKSNPLLEQIYRKMVMGIVDQMLSTSPGEVENK
jgi:hypothetical protein